MQQSLVTVAVAAIAIAVASGAYAQGTPDQSSSKGKGAAVGGAPKGMAKGAPKGQLSPEEIIARMDADGDGKVSREEFQGPSNNFASIDSDQDGFLTLEEFVAARQGSAQRPGGPQNRVRACAFQEVTSPDPRWTIKGYSPDCAFAGTTLFAADAKSRSPRLVEVDMTGRVVWEYRIDLGVGRHLSSKEIAFHQPMDAERLPNGNTLFSLKHLGVYEIDKAGTLVWKHDDDGVSHDVDRLPNGNTIYVRGWAPKGRDHIREVTPNGKLVWRWNGLAQYDREPFADMDREGWMHVNAVTRLPDGLTFFSPRNFQMSVEVNAAGDIVKETRYGGPRWLEYLAMSKKNGNFIPNPHDPEVQPDGTIMVALTSMNRVAWSTSGGAHPIWSRQFSADEANGIRDVNLLPNGNRLVTAFDHLIELDANGRVVWQLSLTREKSSRQNFDDLPGLLYKAQRIAPDGTAYGG